MEENIHFQKHLYSVDRALLLCLGKKAGGFKLRGRLGSNKAGFVVTISQTNQQVCHQLQSCQSLPESETGAHYPACNTVCVLVATI